VEIVQRFFDGARVCFVGDSLTAQNQFLPRIIDAYKRQFPDERVEFINCGVAGGTAECVLDYLEDDVFVHNPTHAVVAFGVNDSLRECLRFPSDPDRYGHLYRAYERYQRCLPEMCERLTARGVQVILATPAPYAEYQESDVEALRGGFALIAGYADYVRQLAREKSLPLCDYHAYMTRQMQGDVLFTPDRVHPNAHGYYHMAKCFLALQGLELGEECELPPYLEAWQQAVAPLRNVYAAECMIVHGYSLPIEEKVRRARKRALEGDYIAQYFAQAFLDHHAHAEECRAQIHTIYARDVWGDKL
jgi:lysophospholipase L1-like esterase